MLQGITRQRVDACIQADNFYSNLSKGIDEEAHQRGLEFYKVMAQYVKNERNRIGGDWAVAQAVPTRALRDHIRSQMGKNLIFVVLHMSKQDQLSRLRARHGDDETILKQFSNIFDVFEPAGDGEPNAIHIEITKDMSRDNVVEKIIRSVYIHEYI